MIVRYHLTLPGGGYIANYLHLIAPHSLNVKELCGIYIINNDYQK